MTPRISPNNLVGLSIGIPRDHNMYLIAIASSVAVLMAQNSALYVEVSTAPCHLLSQLTGVLPTTTSAPVIDLLVFVSCAWSLSKKMDVAKDSPLGSGKAGSISSHTSLY
jgi:hypothetical protein